jgi:alpha-glucosidase (family GH31 glycosyl hydrolase)
VETVLNPNQNQITANVGFINRNGGLINDNVLIQNNTQKFSGAFAQEMENLRKEQGLIRQNSDLTGNKFSEESSKPELIKNFNNGNLNKENTDLKHNLEADLANSKKIEQLKEQQKISQIENSRMSAEEISHKFRHSETTMAAAAQDHHQKQVTEAAREGNIENRESTYEDDANDRKRQLANWDELAPRITEDIKNRAIRIDIPGVKDIKTLIVRMSQNKVNIQAVGDKATMAALDSRKAELAFLLSKKKVNLGELQVFDANTLGKSKSSQVKAA